MHLSNKSSSLTPRQQTWLEEQQQFVRSGLSASEFCRQRLLNISTFYNRRERLAQLGVHNFDTPEQVHASFIDAGSIQSFALPKVREVAQPAASVVPTGIELRIDLGAGMILTLTRH